MLARGLLGRLLAHAERSSPSYNLSNPAVVREILFYRQNVPKFLRATNTARLYATSTAAPKTAKEKLKTRTNPTKKKLVKKPTAKKAAAKPKKKKKAAAKKKPVKPKRKVLTEEQKLAKKEALKAKNAKDKIANLKVVALYKLEPKQKPSNAYTVLNSENSAGEKVNATARAKDSSAKYRNLSASEREHYNHIANQNKADNVAAHTKWVESYTPMQIHLANSARASLRRLNRAGTKTAPRLNNIQDERQLKRPLSAYSLFTKERHASGDLKHIPFREAGTLVRDEYNALSNSEKKVYEDQAAASKQKYAQDYKRVYGKDPPSTKKTATTV